MTFTTETATLLAQIAEAGWHAGFATETGWCISRIVVRADGGQLFNETISGFGKTPLEALDDAEEKIEKGDVDADGRPVVKLAVVRVVHYAGIAITIAGRTIQRCSICGLKLIDVTGDGPVNRFGHCTWVALVGDALIPVVLDPALLPNGICLPLVESD